MEWREKKREKLKNYIRYVDSRRLAGGVLATAAAAVAIWSFCWLVVSGLFFKKKRGLGDGETTTEAVRHADGPKKWRTRKKKMKRVAVVGL